MRGPGAKGMAEVAVSRVRGSGPETPDLENFPVNDFDNNEVKTFCNKIYEPCLHAYSKFSLYAAHIQTKVYYFNSLTIVNKCNIIILQ